MSHFMIVSILYNFYQFIKSSLDIKMSIFEEYRAFKYPHSHPGAMIITKTCLYKFDPLKPHFYIVNGVYRGIYYFSYFSSKHRSWVLVRTASSRRF